MKNAIHAPDAGSQLTEQADVRDHEDRSLTSRCKSILEELQVVTFVPKTTAGGEKLSYPPPSMSFPTEEIAAPALCPHYPIVTSDMSPITFCTDFHPYPV